MDVVKMLFPNADKLFIDNDGNCVAQIVDAELDPVLCEFSDGCVTINTEDLQWVTLSTENLNTLKRLIRQTQKGAEAP